MRKVIIQTANERKFAEHASYFSLYGIEAVQCAHCERPESLLEEDGVIAVLRETSKLRATNGEEIEDWTSPRACTNVGVLKAWVDGGERVYHARVEGLIDPSRGAGEAIFDWDGVFVAAFSGMTYHEMKERGLKRSVRDQLLGAFAMDHLRYAERKDLNWTPVESEQTLYLDIVSFLEEHAFFGPVVRGEEPFDPVLDALLEYSVQRGGAYLRAADNRRTRIYWAPGLNAGIPLTPKKDPFHEATFMFHDLMHFGFPDLIFDREVSEHSARVYITHRMMSECFTLVLADMLFVSGWKERGFEYDYRKRRLYPIAEQFGGSREALLYANARACMLGDMSGYLDGGVSREVLEHFWQKYEQFFVSDYRWTQANYGNLRARFKHSSWVMWASEVSEEFGHDFMTLSRFESSLSAPGAPARELVDEVFAFYHAHMERIASQEHVWDGERAAANAFTRHMTAQMALTFVYDFVPASEAYRSAITTLLLTGAASGAEGRGAVLDLWRSYLSTLGHLALITSEEEELFMDIYPLFDPFYVNYDARSGEGIEDVVRAIYG